MQDASRIAGRSPVGLSQDGDMSRPHDATRLAPCALATFVAACLCVVAVASDEPPIGPIVNPVGPVEISLPSLEEASDPAPQESEGVSDTAISSVDAGTIDEESAADDSSVENSRNGEEDAESKVNAGAIPLAPQEATPLGMPSPSTTPTGNGAKGGGLSGSGKSGWVKQTGAALGVVLALILLGRYGLVALARKSGGLSAMLGAGGRAPSGVMEILARYPVSRGHTLVLLKVDRRVLVLCHTSSGFTTLTEFIEPEEVASILMRVRDEEGESMAARFSQMLHDLSDAPVEEGEAVSPRIAIARNSEDERWPALRTVGGGAR